MSFEFLQGVEFGKDFGVRYYMLGNQIDKLESECNKLRLVYLAAEAKSLASHHYMYWCDLEDVLRDKTSDTVTLETVVDKVSSIFENMKELKSDVIRLSNQVWEKKSLRVRKRKAKSSLRENVESTTSRSPSPSHDDDEQVQE